MEDRQRQVTTREETITTVVKNTRLKRHMSPRTSAMGMYHSETSTPEPPRQRGLVPRKTVPTLYVTEPDGATGKNPKWVEVEEIIEYKVNKSPKLPRRRGASPARSDREHVLTPRPKRSSKTNPNANNNNNNHMEVTQVSTTNQDYQNTSLNLSNVENLLPNVTQVHAETNEEHSSQTTWPGQVHHPSKMSGHRSLTTENAVGGEGDSQSDEELPFMVVSEVETEKVVSAKSLPCGNPPITLEDLEDYVPQEWEAYGRAEAPPPSRGTPSEVSIIQKDINEPTVGQPVILNLDWPVVRAKPPMGFFRRFREHLSGLASVFPTPCSHQEQQPPRRTACASSQLTHTVGSWKSHIDLQVKPQYCSEIQKSFKDKQMSCKTEVSANTQGHRAVGENISIQIIKKDLIPKH